MTPYLISHLYIPVGQSKLPLFILSGATGGSEPSVRSMNDGTFMAPEDIDMLIAIQFDSDGKEKGHDH